MDFIGHLRQWVDGETAQGNVMLCAGAVLLIAMLFVLRSGSAISRGMLLPLAVLVLMNIGYGYVLITRPARAALTEARYREDPQHTMEAEYRKSTSDEKYYAASRYAWPLLVAVSVLLSLLFRKASVTGFSFGLTGMFLGALIIDGFLHNRLQTYIAALEGILAPR